MFNQVSTRVDFVAQEQEVLSYWDRVQAFEFRFRIEDLTEFAKHRLGRADIFGSQFEREVALRRDDE